MKTVSIDVETASVLDLRKVGASRYAEDPSTVITTMSWRADDRSIHSWRWGEELSPELLELALSGDYRFIAWNAAFERQMWNGPLRRQFPHLPPLEVTDWHCTMVQALYWGLAPSLEDAGMALKATVQKDKSARSLMMQMARPRMRKPLRWWHLEDEEKLDRLAKYCTRDVLAERAIYRVLPPLPKAIRKQWILDQRINDRGLYIDVPLVEAMTALAQKELAHLDERMQNLIGATTRQNALVLESLQVAGYPEKDLQRNTLRDRLPLAEGKEREIIQIRLDAARASTAKLDAMLRARCANGRVKHSLQFYGAHTGRSAGRIVQPQNLVRPLFKHSQDYAIADILNGDTEDGLLEVLHGYDTLSVIASCMRGCIIAGPGNVLVSGDFSQIEARVVAWLAGQEDALEVFRSGADIYTHTAEKIGSDNRQLGKVLTLACGFGQGGEKFQQTAKGYSVELSLTESYDAVKAWREANPRIVYLWRALDQAAHMIATRRANVAKVRNLILSRRERHLVIMLPSGRELIYRNIRTQEGPKGPELYYDGWNLGAWRPIKTWGGTICENATQAVAYDLLADALARIEHAQAGTEGARLQVILTVHDDILLEASEAHKNTVLYTLLSLMKVSPHWAKGLPVAAAGWTGKRYRKG
jgi:DNA polymerase bacteriophage-type